jgi:prepilin-type N-terminal cleavage/methylation domain-containing protein
MRLSTIRSDAKPKDLTEDATETDRGFTLIELLIVIVLLGVIMSVLATAIVVSLKTLPATEQRVDDARSTRGLATWLSHDTTSAPRFNPEVPGQGGLDFTSGGNSNDCGGSGINLVHLQWSEQTSINQTFVANYRFVESGGVGTVVRYACSKTGTGAFGAATSLNLTSNLDPALKPTVSITGTSPNVTSITLTLTGESGEIVSVETGTRNPADFFP